MAASNDSEVDDWLDNFETTTEVNEATSLTEAHSDDDISEIRKSYNIEKIMSNFMHPTRGIEVKDRKFRLKTYRSCFVGE